MLMSNNYIYEDGGLTLDEAIEVITSIDKYIKQLRVEHPHIGYYDDAFNSIGKSNLLGLSACGCGGCTYNCIKLEIEQHENSI